MLHVFLHTFCTNMANADMDIKSLQYIIGHSDAGITLNVYTHSSIAG
ncbi:MAG: tyrosine-type recombinase/integrase [Butyricicoccus pullicaecorum]|nr:tyrosine-type recombinase/integrase [Butyricicoccus pullicaecorum]